MTTLSKEDVVQLIEELGAGSNWLSGKYNVYSYNRQPKIAAMFLKAFAEQGLLELIAELRKPHDWKIEGFGHFKDAKTAPSDAPFRAADVLERFADLARADLVAENKRLTSNRKTDEIVLGAMKLELDEIKAENERLKEINNKICEAARDEYQKQCHRYEQLTATRTALAAAEAREEKLHKGLENVKHYLWGGNATAAYNYTSLVLAQPRDDSALREMIAGVYEECAKVCDSHNDYYRNGEACGNKIRALAEKAKGE